MSGETVLQHISPHTIRLGCRVIARRLDLRVEGVEYLPCAGPVLIAARHYHHLYDVAALEAVSPRPLHVLVALDWVQGRRLRVVMERACAAARWPVVLRAERLAEAGGAFRPEDGRRYLHRAVAQSVALLRGGRPLVVFPEAYPNVDPGFTLKTESQPFLPFRPGFVRLVELAQRDGSTRVPILPCGLTYDPGERWRVTVRFGEPRFVDGGGGREGIVAAVSGQVRLLSGG